MKHIKRTARIAKVVHHRTPMNVKVGGAIVALIIAPAILSITMRVVQLGEHVNMYM